jgi:RNA polymerase sigma-70 factor (ECF subfamily)
MDSIPKLIEACLRRERRAEKALYEIHYGFLMSLCVRYTSDREEARELVNAIFVQVFLSLGTFDPARPFIPWLKKIAIRTAIDELRKKSRLPSFIGLEDNLVETEDSGSEEESGVARYSSNLSHDELLGMLKQLPPPLCTVFNLYAIDEIPHEQIAVLLDISTRTSKRHLHNARQFLREAILQRVAQKEAGYGTK